MEGEVEDAAGLLKAWKQLEYNLRLHFHDLTHLMMI